MRKVFIWVAVLFLFMFFANLFSWQQQYGTWATIGGLTAIFVVLLFGSILSIPVRVMWDDHIAGLEDRAVERHVRLREADIRVIEGGGGRQTYIDATRVISAAQGAQVPGINATHYTYSPQITIEGSPSIPQLAAPAVPGPVVSVARPMNAVDLINQLEFDSASILFGVRQSDGAADSLNLPDASHLLITGRSGQGKSALCGLSVTSVLARNSVARLKLACLDVEGIMSSPFKKYSSIYATEPETILEALDELVEMFEARKQAAKRGEFDIDNLPDRWLVYVEEGLVLPTYYTEIADKKKCENLLKRIALMYRKFGLVMLFSAQATLAENSNVSIFRSQFNTRLTGAADKGLLRAVGFDKSDEIDRLCRESRPGQFARQTAQGTSLIDVPLLDMTRVPQLLQHRLQVSASGARPDKVETLPNIELTDEQNQVLAAYQKGFSGRAIAKETGLNRHKVGSILSTLIALKKITGEIPLD